MQHFIRIALVALLSLNPILGFAGVDVGDKPYNRLGKDLRGQTLSAADYEGKVLIITFWATWCGPCMKELPILSTIQKQVGNDKLQVIGINYLEGKKRFKHIATALADNPIIISYDHKGTIAKRYGVDGIPHMVIVGKDGTVVAKHVGYSEKQLPGLVDEINAAINAEYAQ